MQQMIWKRLLAFLLVICVSMRPSEAALNSCGSSCENGIVYLTIPADRVAANQSPVDIVKSLNDFSSIIFSVQVLASKEIAITARLNSTEDSLDGIVASLTTRLRPSYQRRSETKPLVLLLNATSVCVLFENECAIQCSSIAKLVSELTGFF